MNAVQGTYNRHDMYFHNSALSSLFNTKGMLPLRNFHEEYVFHHPIEDYICSSTHNISYTDSASNPTKIRVS
jgi:hypothetical protein